jgi:aminoglycoside phosphotransferase (APT) family kinase protein
VPVIEAPSDRAVLEALRAAGDGREVVDLRRSPYRYATSAPLEELRVRFADGAEVVLILKDLARERLLGDARAAKPAFLHDPRRELETVRRILAPAGIGPRWVAAIAESGPPRHWILMEKVPGKELWQVGELSTWESVAAWLGAFHARFEGQVERLREDNPYLLEYSEGWFELWRERSVTALEGSSDPRTGDLLHALERYDAVVASLVQLPRTLVHGELYPSNVMVVADGGSCSVYPLDWEMAGIGSGLVDFAALAGGYSGGERERLVNAYLCGLTRAGAVAPPRERLDADLHRCSLHLALQWLGWSRDWRPPPEHAHDWLGEALDLAGELRLT